MLDVLAVPLFLIGTANEGNSHAFCCAKKQPSQNMIGSVPKFGSSISLANFCSEGKPIQINGAAPKARYKNMQTR